jgi:nucleoside-diphosphate-sugar epimerase
MPESPDIEIAEGDVTIPESLEGVAEDMDRLLHLATLGHMSNYTVTESMFRKINVQGAVNVMKEAMKSGVEKVVHTSSVAAVGIGNEIPVTEETPCNPHHPYGRSKLEGEKAVLEMARNENLPATIVRFSMVYGPGDWRDILKIVRMFKRGVYPKIGSRPKLTPLIHVRDAVEGLLLAAEKGAPGRIYQITNKRSEPFDKIVETIMDAMDVRKISIPIPEWTALAGASLVEKAFSLMGKTPPVSKKNIESTLADRVFSVQRAMDELGFAPSIDPEKGLRETVLWYKRHKWI